MMGPGGSGPRLFGKRSLRGGLLFIIVGALLLASIAALSWNVAFQKGYELGKSHAQTDAQLEPPLLLPDISAHIVASDHADLAVSKTHDALHEASSEAARKGGANGAEGAEGGAAGEWEEGGEAVMPMPGGDSEGAEPGAEGASQAKGLEPASGGDAGGATAGSQGGDLEPSGSVDRGSAPQGKPGAASEGEGAGGASRAAATGEGVAKQGPVGVRRLEAPLQRSGLTHVFLEYFRRNPKADERSLHFHGTECPQFEAAGANFTGVEACWNSDMVDAEWEDPRPPLNCPDIAGPGGQLAHNPACTQLPQEFVRHEKLASQLFVLHNVYVNSGGQVFNATRHYDRNGCGSDPSDRKFRYPAGTKVTVFREAVNLAHWNAWQFYHGLIETLPQFFVLAKVLPLHRGIPVAHRQSQRRFLDGIGQHLVGLTSSALNIHEIRDNELFFVERLIQPVYQYCARPSRNLWAAFRRHHLVPRDGLPMFNADFSRRLPPEQTPEQLAAVPADWTVVFAKRYGSRGLKESDEVETALRGMLPEGRLTLFDGTLSILEAKALFNRARLFVAVHGAAMTNMIFMPFNASVLELRPRAYVNPCYHYVAEVSGLRYYLLLGEGTKQTATSVNATQVVEVLATIVKEMVAPL